MRIDGCNIEGNTARDSLSRAPRRSYDRLHFLEGKVQGYLPQSKVLVFGGILRRNNNHPTGHLGLDFTVPYPNNWMFGAIFSDGIQQLCIRWHTVNADVWDNIGQDLAFEKRYYLRNIWHVVDSLFAANHFVHPCWWIFS